ncbi:ABC transporter substrate-binding protein [Pseudarthrobacter sp. N5]|uniref:ABC transporter substrate-binding protein n=1 Tax=Pseudarthrobacter sp. N5 TaxID=3418416 RepID=UPI003CF783B1
MTVIRAAAAGAAVLIALTACSGQAGNARLDAVDASGDGTLRIGLILDNTGKQNFLNDSQLAAARLAVQEINAAGGHKGKPVELLKETVGEDTAAQAHALVAAKADVVIGPTDSSGAAAAIDVLSKAKITLISPANTAAALSKYKSGGYYFRTAAADVAQASVLVKLARDGGAKRVSIVYEAGSYGTEVSAAAKAAAGGAGIEAAPAVEFKPGDARRAVATVKDAAPDAVILIAREGAQGAIAELNNAGISGKKLILSDGAFNKYGSGLGSSALDGARAVVPGVFPSAPFQAGLVAVDPGLKDMTFAAETYDAVNLAALAAEAADDDAGASVASWLIAVSGGNPVNGGTAGASGGSAKVCKTFKECHDAMTSGSAVDYDGESGAVGFDANGDVTAANYIVFTYGADNLAKMTGRETAGRTSG